MKIMAISDLHGTLPTLNVPKGDVLCIAGDICPVWNHKLEYQQEWIAKNFVPWCNALIESETVKNVVFCAGNHDWHFEELYTMGNEKDFRKMLPDNIHYLRDSSVIIDGVNFYGTPWTPEFCNWAFMKYEGELDKIFEKIPEGTDVLVSHGPPYGYNDCVEYRQNQHLGSKALIKHINRVKPKAVFVGHIHTGSHDATNLLLEGNFDSRTSIVNVSIMDEQYHVASKPYIMDL
jgi:Icc-related predicted phosphoesterase